MVEIKYLEWGDGEIANQILFLLWKPQAKPRANLRQNLGQTSGKTLGKPWAKPPANLRQTSGKPWENLGQNLGQTWVLTLCKNTWLRTIYEHEPACVILTLLNIYSRL